KQLLGSDGTLAMLQPTHPWLFFSLIFGLPQGSWSFHDDARQDERWISQEEWKGLLTETGFTDVIGVADCPEGNLAQHTVILARAPRLTASPSLAPRANGEAKTWLLLGDGGAAGRPSVGAELALKLQERGDLVIRVTRGGEFRQRDPGTFTVRAGDT